MQATIKTHATFTGVGLHSGSPVQISVVPQPAGTGILFQRTDISGARPIVARFDRVPASRLCTKLVSEDGWDISTIEHIMAAFAGCGIHNALVKVDGAEMPILDGSAAPFVRGFLAAGIEHQGAPIAAFEVLQDIRVTDGDAWAMLSPAGGLEMDYTIDFDDAAIGHQRRVANLANGRFVRELCDSRTFCRRADVEKMHEAGLALGGTYDNAVVVDGDTVLSPGGFRHADEAVRHKMLDALGDLALAGGPILGRYTGVRAGHMVTNQLLRKAFETPGALRRVTCSADQAARLPGVGVKTADLAHVA